MVYERLRYADGGAQDEDEAEVEAESDLGALLPITPAFPVSVDSLRAVVGQRGHFATVACSSADVLRRLVESGSIVKWDPVRPLVPTRAGQISLPRQDPPNVRGAPIVGVVDGGLLPGRYERATAWSEMPLVPDRYAARDHGTHVASLIIDAERDRDGFPLVAFDLTT
jgi:hypothetical protein